MRPTIPALIPVTTLIAVMAAGALSGCAASIPPVSVTRFHLDRAITPGTVMVVPASTTLEQSPYYAAVQREWARLGFATVTTAPRYTYSVEVIRDSQRVARQSPVTIGVGAGTGGGNFGLGVGTAIPIGSNTRMVVRTRLSVQLTDKTTNTVVWEGRAETLGNADSPAGQPGLAADKLASALFRDFPGESGRTITVP